MTTSGLNARALLGGDGRAVLPKPRPTERDRNHMPPSENLRVLQYELDVVASDVLDVVSRVGGWLFDMRMAGWNVGVAFAVAPTGPDDHRALRVLGLKTVELTELWPTATGGPGRGAERAALTAIAAERFENDPALRRRALDDAMRAGEIALWGRGCPGVLGGQLRRIEYRPSAAARAFKAHALAAVGAHDTAHDTGSVAAETVYCGAETVRAGRRVGQLLSTGRNTGPLSVFGYRIQPRRRSHQLRPTSATITAAKPMRNQSSTWPT